MARLWPALAHAPTLVPCHEPGPLLPTVSAKREMGRSISRSALTVGGNLATARVAGGVSGAACDGAWMRSSAAEVGSRSCRAGRIPTVRRLWTRSCKRWGRGSAPLRLFGQPRPTLPRERKALYSSALVTVCVPSARNAGERTLIRSRPGTQSAGYRSRPSARVRMRTCPRSKRVYPRKTPATSSRLPTRCDSRSRFAVSASNCSIARAISSC